LVIVIFNKIVCFNCSEHWPPRPQHSIFRQDFQKEQNELRIFISPGSLNGAGTYNLGLVETSLNSGRRHKTEVVQRQYALSAWFGSCVFWNTSRAVWSDQGCRVSPRTTATVAHCRCDHLTAFGSHFELVPNDLSFTHVEHFFSLHENPVVIVLVAVVMVIYIILLVIALRADAHDRQKGGLVCLSDNNITDSQIYEVVLDTGLSQSTPSTAKVTCLQQSEWLAFCKLPVIKKKLADAFMSRCQQPHHKDLY
ncbi:polycystin-1-like protein 2, partial [Littorina saxatilis]|uniref:polycystin-1-like protein 2 n=1 Tax=Littorina saxatilis TaxID=31220 RepID=UPI0038B45FEA